MIGTQSIDNEHSSPWFEHPAYLRQRLLFERCGKMVKGQAADDDIKGVICKRHDLDGLYTKIYCAPKACRLLTRACNHFRGCIDSYDLSIRPDLLLYRKRQVACATSNIEHRLSRLKMRQVSSTPPEGCGSSQHDQGNEEVVPGGPVNCPSFCDGTGVLRRCVLMLCHCHSSMLY